MRLFYLVRVRGAVCGAVLSTINTFDYLVSRDTIFSASLRKHRLGVYGTAVGPSTC